MPSRWLRRRKSLKRLNLLSSPSWSLNKILKSNQPCTGKSLRKVIGRSQVCKVSKEINLVWHSSPGCLMNKISLKVSKKLCKGWKMFRKKKIRSKNNLERARLAKDMTKTSWVGWNHQAFSIEKRNKASRDLAKRASQRFFALKSKLHLPSKYELILIW